MGFDVKQFEIDVKKEKEARDEVKTEVEIKDKPGSFMGTDEEISQGYETPSLGFGDHDVKVKRVWASFTAEGDPYIAVAYLGTGGEKKDKEEVDFFRVKKKDGTPNYYRQNAAREMIIDIVKVAEKENAREIIESALKAAHESGNASTLYDFEKDEVVYGVLRVWLENGWTKRDFQNGAFGEIDFG